MKQVIVKQLTTIYNFILDLIFPKYCVGCEKEGSWICEECRKKIVLIQKPTCPICNRLTSKGEVCSRCGKKSYLTGLIVTAYYDKGPLKEAIHTFKYEGVFDIAKDLGQILAKTLEKQKMNKNLFIIPVPLHPKRQAQRGFNQAELLAEQLKTEDRRLKTEDLRPKTKNKNQQQKLIKNKLVRIKYTKKTQVELSGKARRENVRGVFAWRGQKDELKGKTVLLVDDVYTTGSTLQECAKILRQEAGVRQVWGIVLAKG